MTDNQVLHGDCIEVLKQFPDNHFTACVTDPPYGLSEQPDMAEVLAHWLAGDDYTHRSNGFMGKSWDSFVPGPATWGEVYRVLKPGATLLCFAGRRTQDLMGISLRLAGFEVFDTIMWVFGQGFGGLGLNVGKAIDKAAIVECPDCQGSGWEVPEPADVKGEKFIEVDGIGICEGCKGEGKVKGAEREVVGMKPKTGGGRARSSHEGWQRPWMKEEGAIDKPFEITAPATPEAALFEGYNSQIKPAYEPVICARKPNVSTYAANALEFGVAGMNIDGCRVGYKDGITPDMEQHKYKGKGKSPSAIFGNVQQDSQEPSNPKGRYPPNLLLECSCGAGQGGKHAEDCVCGMLDKDSGKYSNGSGPRIQKHYASIGYGGSDVEFSTYVPGDKGGASRYFPNLPADAARFKYSPKAPQKERAHYKHPTQKPEALLDWLCRLVKMPEHNLILDPFAGTGTTLIAAIKNGMGYVGIEQEPEFVEAINHRIATYTSQPYDEPPAKSKPNDKAREPKQMKLF